MRELQRDLTYDEYIHWIAFKTVAIEQWQLTTDNGEKGDLPAVFGTW